MQGSDKCNFGNGYGRGCGAPYGGDRQEERQNSDRTMVQKAVVGDSCEGFIAAPLALVRVFDGLLAVGVNGLRW